MDPFDFELMDICFRIPKGPFSFISDAKNVSTQRDSQNKKSLEGQHEEEVNSYLGHHQKHQPLTESALAVLNTSNPDAMNSYGESLCAEAGSDDGEFYSRLAQLRNEQSSAYANLLPTIGTSKRSVEQLFTGNADVFGTTWDLPPTIDTSEYGALDATTADPPERSVAGEITGGLRSNYACLADLADPVDESDELLRVGFVDMFSSLAFPVNGNDSLNGEISGNLTLHQKIGETICKCGNCYTDESALIRHAINSNGIFEPIGDRDQSFMSKANPQPLLEKPDPAITDSGYASTSRLDLPSNALAPLNMSQPAYDNVNREDAETRYSAATTMAEDHVQHYIVELCNDIHSKLRHCFDVESWSALSSDLPGLVKAFAIRFGHSSSAQVDRDITYFIHSHHKKIVTQLETMFLPGEENESEICQDDTECMALGEKMLMWREKLADDPVVFNDTRFEGVEGEADHLPELTTLPVYNKIILKSEAYKWFITSLKKEFTLQWTATRPRVMIEDIRRKILNQLPTGKISKRQAPDAHTVTFDLDWRVEMRKRLQGKFQGPTGSGQSLVESITLTGSPEEAQVLTIEQYLKQTWPTNGQGLLNVLQETIDSHPCHSSVTFPDGTRVEAKIVASRLFVTATGPAYFIAECGEQLAWLGAVLLGDSRHLTGGWTPLITCRASPSPSIKSEHQRRFHVGLDTERLEISANGTSQWQNSWHDLVEDSMVILGFPVSRRPKGYTGLELSYDVLLHLLHVDKPIIFNELVLIKGPKMSLQLIKRTENVFLWYLFDPSRIMAGIPGAPVNLHQLETGRHILSTYTDLQTVVPQTISSKVVSSKLGLAGAEYTPLQPSGLTDPYYNETDPFYVRPAICDSGRCRTFPDTRAAEASHGPPFANILCDSSHGPSRLTHASSPSEPGGSEMEVQPVAVKESPGDSFDSDLFSISEASADLLYRDDPAQEALVALSRRLLAEYRTAFRCHTSPHETATASAAGFSTENHSQQLRKRSREENCDDDNDADETGFQRPPAKKINAGQVKTPEKIFACPYLKKDPAKHRRCCTYQLRRIRDIKQHLIRKHTPKLYCPRCLVEFSNDESYQMHFNQITCQRQDPSTQEAISYQQRALLHQRAPRNLSEEGQWFVIWGILFPRCPKPNSAYMDPRWTIEVLDLREYFIVHGSASIREIILSDQGWLRPDITIEQQHEYVDRLIAHGIDALFEDWQQTIPHGSLEAGSASASTHPADGSLLTRYQTSTDSVADSGVVLGSKSSFGESTPRRDQLEQSTSTVQLDSQSVAVDSRIQAVPGMEVDTAGPSQSHRQGIPDSIPELPFDEEGFGDSLIDWPDSDANAPYSSELSPTGQPQDFEVSYSSLPLFENCTVGDQLEEDGRPKGKGREQLWQSGSRD